MAEVFTVLRVEGPAGQTRIAAVVDTGSFMSIVPPDVLESIGALGPGAEIVVSGAFGESCVRETRTVTVGLLQHGKAVHTLPVIVGDQGKDALVGMDLIELEGLVIDAVAGQLKRKEASEPEFPKGAIPLPGGGYALNVPKGYEKTLARRRFESMKEGAPTDNRGSGTDLFPTRPTGFKVRR